MTCVEQNSGTLEGSGVDSRQPKENPAINYEPPERMGLDNTGTPHAVTEWGYQANLRGEDGTLQCVQAKL